MATERSSPLRLVNPSDDQLCSAFAEHVCKYRRTEKPDDWADDDTTQFWVKPETGRAMIGTAWRSDSFENGKWSHSWKFADFTKSSDAVLPFLQKHNVEMRYCRDAIFWQVIIDHNEEEKSSMDHNMLFAKAALLCLLRAHGSEVSFT